MAKIISGVNVYDLKETSEKFGLSIQSLRTYIKEGRLKAKKFGNSYRITETALKEYFEIA